MNKKSRTLGISEMCYMHNPHAGEETLWGPTSAWVGISDDKSLP